MFVTEKVVSMKMMKAIYRYVVPILAGIACFLFYSRLINVGTDLHHDGVMLKPALDVASGRSLFKETFTHYGPLATYLNAFGIWVWGPKLISIRIITVLSYAITFGLITGAAVRLLPPFMALLIVSTECVVQYGYTLPWASVHANLFLALSFLAIVLYMENQNAFWALLAGVGCALSFWCRQAVGIASLTSLLVILALSSIAFHRKYNTRLLLAFLGGTILAIGILLGNYYFKDSFSAMVMQTITWPQRWEIVMRGAATHDETSMLYHLYNVLFGKVSEFLPSVALYFASLVALSISSHKFQNSSRILQLVLAAFLSLVIFGISSWFGLFANLQFGFSRATVVIALLSSCAMFVRCLNHFRTEEFLTIVLGGIVVSGWIHSYPLADGPHMAWGTGFTFFYLILLTRVFIKKVAYSSALLVALFVGPLYSGISNIQKVRTSTPSQINLTNDPNSIFYGMVTTEIPKDVIWEAAFYVESVIRRSPETPIINFTDDGMFAALAKNLAMPDPYYVWWGWLGFDKIMGFSYETRRDFIIKQRPVIVAHELMENLFLKSLRENDGYIQSRKFGPYVIFLHDSLLVKIGRK